ncbi:MAG TPA: cation-transporting P-type ATPase [Sulfuricurvum sp.]|nr:MAG: cation transporter [Campylobacterales bacterium 16-40-21]OZA03875.1 MAG: cation transporter [Sulfuricurvum sp. 17-40-25]HQS65602.1 cation-transporting P-type ATPase [Sulfuricurvum sp.]HQT36215.1 cation-transporting P-type ATPase [Sulfuricurvum sp.]
MQASIEAPHSKTPEELYLLLDSSPSGVEASSALQRQRLYGRNLLKDEQRSYLAIFISQFMSPIVLILIIAALLSLAMGHTTDSMIIIGILVINSLLGFVQEYRAETSIRALKKLTETHVRVLRMGMEALIPSDDLVPGDVVFLGEGDLVSADIRLIESHALQADEATLTGESIPSNKQSLQLLHADALPYERSNMLFSGTHILKGVATGIVTATGEHTYLATIAKSAQEKSPHSPLTRSLAIFSKRLIIILIAILFIVGIIGLQQGRSTEEITSILIAELVSAVPEGLAIVVTLILALGAYRLSRHKVLVRHLPSVESLGSASVIATDKTGTITEGFLSVSTIEALDQEGLKMCAALCNDATAQHGDSVDMALVRWINDEYSILRDNNPRVFYHPFDPTTRLMATVNQNESTERLYIKGAYEALLALSQNNSEELEQLRNAHDTMALQGLRVLAFGISDEKWEDPAQWTIRLVGLIGFADAAKSGVADAVQQAKEAGIRVIMVTGDNPLTAQVIAKEVGIWQEGDTVLNGHDIEGMDDEQLQHILQTCTVAARALPEHKYRIVKLLQAKGEIVAVTGDGVNDVPALKAADLGIAMGNGSEAAKSTSKMVITDNNLGVIVDAIRQGRIIAANLRKVIFYLVATCFDEIIIISGAIIMGLPLPIHPTQILWVNIVTDGVTDKTFPMCHEEGNVMKNTPRRLDTQFFDRWQIARISWVSLVNGLVTLAVFIHLLDTGHTYESALTVSFCIIVTSQWVNGILAQKEEEPFFLNIRRSLTINPWIWVGISIGIVLQGIALYVVPQWFHAIPPNKEMLIYIGISTAIVFLLIEAYKWGEWALKKSIANAKSISYNADQNTQRAV